MTLPAYHVERLFIDRRGFALKLLWDAVMPENNKKTPEPAKVREPVENIFCGPFVKR